MAASIATIDAKGRVSIPREVRDSLGLESGDAVFIETDENKQFVRMAKAINPLDILAELANHEFERGETTSLRDFAKEMGIKLDER